MARPKKATAETERAQRAAQMQRRAQAKERRRTLIVWGVAGALVVAIIATVAIVILRDQANRPTLDAVETFENLSADHVGSEVDYEQTPPVGGDHNPVWWNCGVYEEPVADEHAVHSLEHGTVWITYDPDLPEDQVSELEDAANAPYMLLSPHEGLDDNEIYASAWGLQLQLDNAEDRRLEEFIREYRQGPQTPEPGAACTGGTDTSRIGG